MGKWLCLYSFQAFALFFGPWANSSICVFHVHYLYRGVNNPYLYTNPYPSSSLVGGARIYGWTVSEYWGHFQYWCQKGVLIFFYIKVNMIFSKIKCILKGWKIIISYFIGRPTSACLHSLLCTLSSQSWPIYSSTVLYNYQTHSVYSLGLLYSSLEQCFLPPEIPFLHSLGQTLLHDCMQQNVSKLIGGSMH